MGKLKKGRRTHKGRLNPLAKKDSNLSKQDVKDETIRQNKIVPLISKLSSSAPNDRSIALSAITVLVEDEKMRKMLLKEKLVATVMEQTLHDSNDELVVDSFGLLRNLVIEEGHDVAKFIWRSNIWAAIDAGLTKIEQSFTYLTSETKKLDKKRTYMLFDFIENILSLVVLIASCSDELYTNIYSHIDRIASLVVQLLNWNLSNPQTTKLFNSLLDFIYEFASYSADFITSLSGYESFSLPNLIEAMQLPVHEKNKLGQVYVQGISFHFLEVNGGVSNKESSCGEILTKVFNNIKDIDLEQVCSQLSGTDNANEPIQKPQPDEKPQDIDVPFGGSSPEKMAAQAELQACEIAIDLFTSICEFLAVNEEGLQEQVSLSNDMVQFLLTVAYPTCLHLLIFDQNHGHLLHLTPKLLEALNNLCWLFLSNETLPAEWFHKVPELWLAVESASSVDNLEYQKLSLGILWALCKSVGPEIRGKVTLDNVKSLLTKCTTLTSSLSEAQDPVESLEFILSAVGFLGSVAQVIENVEATREIGDFLLNEIGHFVQPKNNLKEPKAIEIPVESLNLIYDIFGDAEYSYDLPVFVEGEYLRKLSELEPGVKACYKQIDKGRNPELKIRAEEAWTNLGRFVDYKRSERR